MNRHHPSESSRTCFLKNLLPLQGLGPYLPDLLSMHVSALQITVISGYVNKYDTVSQTEEEGLRLLRHTHKFLFRNGTISDAHDVNAWRAYTRGDSESAFRNQYPPNPRLRK